MDFSLEKYTTLLRTFKKHNYNTCTFNEYFSRDFFSKEKTLILRHDVDAKPHNSLEIAKIENRLNMQGTFYFRNRSSSFDKNIRSSYDSFFGHFKITVVSLSGKIKNNFISRTQDEKEQREEKTWKETKYRPSSFRTNLYGAQLKNYTDNHGR